MHKSVLADDVLPDGAALSYVIHGEKSLMGLRKMVLSSALTAASGSLHQSERKGRILEVLKNWPEKKIQVIVVTDGERILGLGDLGCQGMGIPVGKLSLYSALGGIRPSAVMLARIDVGTNNEQLLNDEFYIGLRRRRATGQEYAELLHEFMSAVKQNYGEKVLVHHNAFDLLAKYGSTHLVFNDDIQGTASVVLAGLMAGLNLVGGTLADHRFLFLGAGELCVGLSCFPQGTWYCKYCKNMFEKEKYAERDANAIAAGRVPGVDPLADITQRCIRIVATFEADVGGCAICRELDFSKSVFDSRTVIICDQVLNMEELYSSHDIHDVLRRWAGCFLEVIT
ncbi:hypothetical protein CASFOL_016673 [Castilleja foliolosa]|uniref:Malic enzyme n=1 Tax=Castilleja foliolosa TaxID=1961234 RepID=A0ABD3D8X2_9LAMI